MQSRIGPMSIIRERFHWGSYGFVIGLVLGLLLGWFLHGAVGAAFLGVVVLLLVALAILFFVWRTVTDRRKIREAAPRHDVLRDQHGDAIDSDSFVIDARDEREAVIETRDERQER